MFVNVSNHPVEEWEPEQLEAAQVLGAPVLDYPFPQVDPKASSQQVLQLAADIAAELAALKPDAVLCQGEFTLCFALVNRLKELGIPVFAACSQRRAKVKRGKSGVVKTAVFQFVQFRPY